MPGSQADQIYFAASKGPLKLKGVMESGIKKKKKKSKKNREPSANTGLRSNNEEDNVESMSDLVHVPTSSSGSGYSATRTKAEQHFMERQRQREEQRIQKKAAKSHKEKVEEFNRNLDSQSEHFDIPKVSWTK